MAERPLASTKARISGWICLGADVLMAGLEIASRLRETDPPANLFIPAAVFVVVGVLCLWLDRVFMRAYTTPRRRSRTR